MENTFYQSSSGTSQYEGSNDGMGLDEEEHMLKSIKNSLKDRFIKALQIHQWSLITETATWAGRFVSFLLPSFVHGSEAHDTRPLTSPLDGLRGYAAFAVMNYHILYAYQKIVFHGYGLLKISREHPLGFAKGTAAVASSLLHRPIRLLGFGKWHNMVGIFVISKTIHR
ncbi:hypothetical protein N7501_010693 [Penicillium viridicatum]|nr:hypothetical protein N7501_010693 [Penicillium viridicatum]